jgi:NitT/TauT family transport system substrate-binding protein
MTPRRVWQMMETRRGVLFLLSAILLSFVIGQSASGENRHKSEIPAIGMAVEFMDHAACAYVAIDKGWFREEGLPISVYESYVTGMALAAALARGDIQVAYMCLVPAINVYANARVPIKVVAGTHKHGYGLVVNPEKVKDCYGLEEPGIRIGCVREGGAVDVVLHKTMEKYHLDKGKVLNNVIRMNPPEQVLAIRMGRLDVAFLPEQWATMAEDFRFKMLATSQDVWPEMQGSVLVVKEELIQNNPEVVKKLVSVTKRATKWLNENRASASIIVARQLSSAKGEVLPSEAGKLTTALDITPQTISRSMDRMVFTTDLDQRVIEDMIHYMTQLGYIRGVIKAQDIVDMGFLHVE